MFLYKNIYIYIYTVQNVATHLEIQKNAPSEYTVRPPKSHLNNSVIWAYFQMYTGKSFAIFNVDQKTRMEHEVNEWEVDEHKSSH